MAKVLTIAHLCILLVRAVGAQNPCRGWGSPAGNAFPAIHGVSGVRVRSLLLKEQELGLGGAVGTRLCCLGSSLAAARWEIGTGEANLGTGASPAMDLSRAGSTPSARTCEGAFYSQ